VTENGVGQAGSCRHCGSHSFVSGVVDRSRPVIHVLYTVSRNISTRCNQQNSKLANLEATVEVVQGHYSGEMEKFI